MSVTDLFIFSRVCIRVCYSTICSISGQVPLKYLWCQPYPSEVEYYNLIRLLKILSLRILVSSKRNKDIFIKIKEWQFWKIPKLFWLKVGWSAWQIFVLRRSNVSPFVSMRGRQTAKSICINVTTNPASWLVDLAWGSVEHWGLRLIFAEILSEPYYLS